MLLRLSVSSDVPFYSQCFFLFFICEETSHTLDDERTFFTFICPLLRNLFAQFFCFIILIIGICIKVLCGIKFLNWMMVGLNSLII
jgi:hypothetical protein